jgi:hypothetical protein
MISDPAALQYIFVKSGYRFPRQQDHNVLSKLTNGRGILWAVGEFLGTRTEHEMIYY